MKRRKAFAYKIILFFMLLLNSLYAFSEQSILFIHSYHQMRPWTVQQIQGFELAFEESQNVALAHEFLGAQRYQENKPTEDFILYLKEKYAHANIDVIVITDNNALDLVRKNKHHFFPEIPMVFLGINQIDQTLIDTPNITGVFENRDIDQAIIDIKSITNVNEIVVIKEASNWRKLEAKKNIHIMNNLSDDAITQAFANIDKDVPILLMGKMISPSNNNILLPIVYSTEILSKALPNPIFTVNENTLKYGAAGAYVLKATKHAQNASILIKQILQGTPVDDINPITKEQSQWTFNWVAMNARSISMESLPESSTIINKEPSFYDKYKVMVWLVGLAFIASSIIILTLIEMNRRGRKNQSILMENEARYRDLAHAGANIFWETDLNHMVTYVSDNTENIFDFHVSTLIGKDMSDLFQQENILDFPLQPYLQTIREQRSIKNTVFKSKQSNENVKVLLVNAKPMYQEDNKTFKGYRGIIKEITQEHLLTQKLAYQATYDVLTGLMNRTSFQSRLEESMLLHSQGAQSAFLCVLDLDRFKLVNDTVGHLVGDDMLKKIADIMLTCITDQDVLARLGGDEFGLMLINKDQSQTTDICETIIKKISDFQYRWNQSFFNVGVSIGVMPVSNTFNVIELLNKADLSCYKAKEYGRNRVYFSDPDNYDLHIEELQRGYISNLSQVIEKKQFYLVKQVISPLEQNTNSSLHYEILLRYNDDNGQPIPPSLFIPAAEKHGVICVIDEWVVTTILGKYHEYFPEGNTLVSINLSGITLSNDELIAKIKKLVTSSSVKMENICFEITETAAITQLSQALDFIFDMKKLGVKFALDDFGSGASSFGYLKNLPVDYLKIDGSLIKNIVTEPTDRAIVESINSIAHMMGMKTIAEFVENDAIQTVLMDIGIDYVQGHGIGYPIDC